MWRSIAAGFAAFLATAGGIALAQGGPPPGGFGSRALMRADANGDGVVTRDEYLADAARRFDRLDLNHDGKIDGAEMQQMGQMRGPGGGGRRGYGGGEGGTMPPPPPAGTPQQ